MLEKILLMRQGLCIIRTKKNKLKIDYKVASPEMLKNKTRFDVILNMEIVEHVNDLEFFIKESSKLLKKME